MERSIGKSSKRSKIACKLNYKKQRMLQYFRIKEDEAPCNDPSMSEIMYKQGPSRGLTIVRDVMFEVFFIALNTLVQSSLSSFHFHLHGEQIFTYCRNVVDSNEDILQKWVRLFGNFEDPDLEDEIFLTLMEIFKDITEHFMRVAFVDALKYFKSTIPRKKKQALRSKISALGDRDSRPKQQKKEQSIVVEPKKQKRGQSSVVETESDTVYKCNSCNVICEWEPELLEYESIACDKCNCWFHYKCANIKGTETFFFKNTIHMVL